MTDVNSMSLEHLLNLSKHKLLSLHNETVMVPDWPPYREVITISSSSYMYKQYQQMCIQHYNEQYIQKNEGEQKMPVSSNKMADCLKADKNINQK